LNFLREFCESSLPFVPVLIQNGNMGKTSRKEEAIVSDLYLFSYQTGERRPLAPRRHGRNVHQMTHEILVIDTEQRYHALPQLRTLLLLLVNNRNEFRIFKFG
jgi:hypothetical protein